MDIGVKSVIHAFPTTKCIKDLVTGYYCSNSDSSEADRCSVFSSTGRLEGES